MNNKEKVIAKLKGELEVTKVTRTNYAGEPAINIQFEKNGKKAECVYTFFGEDGGIEECNYQEQDDEDIYAELHEWIDEYLDVSLKVKWDGKDVEW